MSRKILPVIMCGGAGTRVWPESRETMPKQFIPLIGKSSTFQETVRRVSDAIFDAPIVVTNRDYRFLVREQLEEIGAQATIVIEPSRRDSGPAVAVAAELAANRDPADGGGGVRGRSRDPRSERVSARLRGRGRRGGGRLYRDARRHARRTGRRLWLYPAGRADRRGQGAARGGFRREAQSRRRRALRRRGVSVEFRQFLLSRRRDARRIARARTGDGRGDGARARSRRRRPRIPRARSARPSPRRRRDRSITP